VRVLAALASVATAGVMIYTAGGTPAGATPGGGGPRLAASVPQARLGAGKHPTASRTGGADRPTGRAGSTESSTPTPTSVAERLLPSSGRVAALVRLRMPSTSAVYDKAAGAGRVAASRAARQQLTRIRLAQSQLTTRLSRVAPGSRELYRMHGLMPAVAVLTDVRNLPALRRMRGVEAVYPIAPKKASNSYAVPLVGAPQSWTDYGDVGADSTIAIIDTGIDYTHANFGGPGTTSAYTTALAGDAAAANPLLFPSAKVIGGTDLVGDAYDADSIANSTPDPDPNPLDCNGHGSHVAGTAAGYGVTSAGARYAGAYDNTTPFATMRIGPGVAPGALLYAFKVFGCEGSTSVVADAIDMAMDPNDDGDPSDHVDVINMSLGADFGSPGDGDSVAAAMAADDNVSVVVSSGNAGDTYDVGGSPGDARSVLTVANSVDAYNQVDSVHVSVPVALAGRGRTPRDGGGDKAAERSINYTDWVGNDLSGDLAKPADPLNADGCDPLTGDLTLTGKVVFLEWTAGTRRCGSTARADNVEAAGGVGFLLDDDEEVFTAGISGNATIPGVMVVKSAGDDIAADMAIGTVHVDSTGSMDFRQIVPADDDKVNDSSSRGIRLNGNVKPDVTAVGTSVFSTAMGTGNQGVSFTGTSMAAPMVTGTAALIRTRHPDWSSLEVKADIVNTAGQDLSTTGPSLTGHSFAPNRVGSGRLQANLALNNQVVAYDQSDPGAVSVSFGPVAATGPTTLSKTVRVVNKGLSAVSYAIAYEPLTTVPGVTYSVFPNSVSIDRKSAKTFAVTLSIADAAVLTKTIDPTVASTIAVPGSGSLPRNFLADASGRVLLTSADLPTLRVPVYSAPRPASVMTQPAAIGLPGGTIQNSNLPLFGSGVSQGSGPTQVQSIVTAAELQAVSGQAPTCMSSLVPRTGCIRLPEERSADLKYVGSTSDAPLFQDPMDGLAYFAINTWGRWQTEVSKQQFQVWIDSTGDGVPDEVLFTTRLVAGSDIFVTELDTLDPNVPDNQRALDVEPINVELGDVDTAEFDSDTLLMPVAISALPGVSDGHSRINYGVLSYSGFASTPIDMIGVNGNGDLVHPLSMDVLRPGVTVANDESLLYQDLPDTALPVRRDAPAYAGDHGMGAMVIHFHNTTGNKTQLVALRSPGEVTVSLSATTVRRGTPVNATATVRNTLGVATGMVRIVRAPGVTIAAGRLEDGRAVIRLPNLGRGTYGIYAIYAGDENYLPDYSNVVPLRVVT
jgi:subtilisin family serine protease